MSIIQRNKKVAAGIGIAAAAAAAIALGTGTFAAFTATAAGPGGTLAAGTMVLEVGGSASALLFNDTGIYPTQVIPAKVVTFKNNSPVPATLSGVLSLSGATDGGTNGAQLQNELTMASSCTVASGPATTTPATIISSVGGAVVSGAVAGSPLELPAGATATCTFTFNLPDRPDNDLVQGDGVIVASNFTLTQKITL
jgi:spore coat-associated protein N